MKIITNNFNNREKESPDMESIGFDWKEFNVNEDVKIYVSTNLGLGDCTYFTLALRYKGIDILLYGSAVNSYYAEMKDILLYQKNYTPKSESWNLALNFIENITNLVATDAESFCEKFLNNEIDSLLAGLAVAVENPEAFLNNFSTKTSEENDPEFITVRVHMNEEERLKFKAYPYEMSVVFMAEKIINALMLLHNLQLLSTVYPQAQDAIEKIKETAIAGLPKIKECVSKIICQLNELRESRDELIEKVNEGIITRLEFMDILNDCIEKIENLCDKEL